MASQKTKPHPAKSTTRRLAAWYRNPQNWMVAGLVIFTVAVVAFKLGFHVHPAVDIDRTAIATTELSYPQMAEIEKMFVCPCGNCGELELEVCACEGPGGALEMKTTIARMLRSGSNVDEIVAVVTTQFGGLKPTAASAQNSLPDEQPESTVVDNPNAVPLHSAHDQDADPNDVLKVVSAFDCPCGNCALTLLECTCDHAHGAVEIKAYVRAKLASGLSPEQVIDDIDRTYGGRWYSNLLNDVSGTSFTE